MNEIILAWIAWKLDAPWWIWTLLAAKIIMSIKLIPMAIRLWKADQEWKKKWPM